MPEQDISTPTPLNTPPTPAQSEAQTAAETVGIGAGAGGTTVLEEITKGNPGALGGDSAHSG